MEETNDYEWRYKPAILKLCIRMYLADGGDQPVRAEKQMIWLNESIKR